MQVIELLTHSLAIIHTLEQYTHNIHAIFLQFQLFYQIFCLKLSNLWDKITQVPRDSPRQFFDIILIALELHKKVFQTCGSVAIWDILCFSEAIFLIF